MQQGDASQLLVTTTAHAADGLWYCTGGCAGGDFKNKPCSICQEAGDDEGPVCDRCNGVFHEACMEVDARSRFASCKEICTCWFCDVCQHAAQQDENLRVAADRAFNGVRVPKVMADILLGASGAGERRRAPTSPFERLRLPSSTNPWLFSWTNRVLADTRLAIYIPGFETGMDVYEVIPAGETPLFDEYSLLRNSSIYFLTGERHPISIVSEALNHDLFPPEITHVGHVPGWSVPDGCRALLPMCIDCTTME